MGPMGETAVARVEASLQAIEETQPQVERLHLGTCRRCVGPGPGAGRAGSGRAAPRTSRRGQGPLRHRRSADDRLLRRLRGPSRHGGLGCRGGAAGGRRGDRGEDQPARAGRRRNRPRLVVRAGVEPLGRGSDRRRLVVRIGGGGGRRCRDPGHRLGHRRLDPHPGVVLRHHRSEADPRPGQPAGCDADEPGLRHRRPDGADRGAVRRCVPGPDRRRCRSVATGPERRRVADRASGAVFSESSSRDPGRHRGGRRHPRETRSGGRAPRRPRYRRGMERLPARLGRPGAPPRRHRRRRSGLPRA